MKMFETRLPANMTPVSGSSVDIAQGPKQDLRPNENAGHVCQMHLTSMSLSNGRVLCGLSTCSCTSQIMEELSKTFQESVEKDQ